MPKSPISRLWGTLATFLLGGKPLSTAVGVGSAAEPQPTPRVAVPKWLAQPTLDSHCSDPAYADAPAAAIALVGGAGQVKGQVRLTHSALDVYLCFSDLPVGAGQKLAVLIDGNNSKSATALPGVYAFSITPSGALSVTQAITTGSFVPLTLPAADFAGAVSDPLSSTWGAELRISLEWFGGYARTAGAALSLQQDQGAALIGASSPGR